MKQLCHYSDIDEGKAKGFTLDGVKLIAVKLHGNLSIYLNQCPHLGIPLEYAPDQFLDSTDSYIVCSNHGALFNITDGLCISGPCINDSLSSIPFEVLENRVLIDISQIRTNLSLYMMKV